MSDPEHELRDEYIPLPWELLTKENGLWLALYKPEDVLPSSLINLGPKEQVMEAFSQFLEHEDFGEVMK